jgi:hypothetical protein
VFSPIFLFIIPEISGGISCVCWRESGVSSCVGGMVGIEGSDWVEGEWGRGDGVRRCEADAIEERRFLLLLSRVA